MKNVTELRLKFWQCRAVERDLWDYAGERLAEGPMERVEGHLTMCRACRREVAQWKRAQGLLDTAQAAPLPTARLGWNDLQTRIAADVAAFGPPRPDKDRTRQAVAQLIAPRRSSGSLKISALRPAFGGVMALTLAFVLLAHRAPNAPQSAPGVTQLSVPALTAALPNAAPPSLPIAPTPFSAMTLTDSLALPAPPIPMPVTETAAVKSAAPPDAVKTPPAPKQIASVPAQVKTPQPPRPKTAAKTAQKPAPRQMATVRPQPAPPDKGIQFTPHDPTAAEHAPDASEVADGVIGALVPVSHEEDSVY